MVRADYRSQLCKCNDFNENGLFGRDSHRSPEDQRSGVRDSISFHGFLLGPGQILDGRCPIDIKSHNVVYTTVRYS